jgi:hypothetical protein
MKLFEKIPMTFEGKAYEIRVLYDKDTVNVAVFRNNFPANGFRHQIKIPGKCRVEGILEKGAAAELVEMSKRDITEKRWEKITGIIKNNMQ